MSALLIFVSMFSVILLMPFFLEKELGYSTREVGIVFLAFPVVMSVISPLSGWLSDRMDSNVLSSIGLGIAAVSLFSLGFLSGSSSFAEVISRMAILGFGAGLFQAPNNSIIMSSLPKEQHGVAAGVLGTMRNMGMVIGIAISGAVFTNRYAHYEGTETSFMSAVQDTYIVSAIICGIAVFASLARSTQEEDTV